MDTNFSNDIRPLQPNDADLILKYETTRLQQTVPDEDERTFKAWHASWRAESLAHYLPLGWSFGVFQDEKLVGYFLGQLQLFTRGLTQTLWIEYIVGNDDEIISELKDIAAKLAREKHLQKVEFNG